MGVITAMCQCIRHSCVVPETESTNAIDDATVHLSRIGDLPVPSPEIQSHDHDVDHTKLTRL